MINGANTGFMLLAASLVMLMTPGLAFFYGGLVGRSSTLTIMIQSFASMGITTVLWWAGRLLALLQRRQRTASTGTSTSRFLRGVGVHSLYAPSRHPARGADRLPDDVRDHHAGADHRRVHEPRDVQGVPDLPRRLAAVRLLPVRAHDLGRRAARALGRPRLRRRHRRPRAAPAGPRSRRCSTSASAGSSTRRTTSRSSRSAPACSGSAGTASTPGSELKVDDITALAFLNTDLAASFAATTWLFIEWWYAKKPHFVGLLTGAVAGLATITPAAGYVPIYAVRRHRDRGRAGLLLRDPAQEPAEVGRRARRLGRARHGRPARHRPARASSPARRSTRRRRRA